MAYKTKELLKKAIDAIQEKKLFFIEDIITMLPCDKTTFYRHFRVGGEELDMIKAELEKNRVAIKTSMRKKWFESSNPTLQIALMKLICTDEERKKISNNYIEQTESGGSETNQIFKIGEQVIRFN
jgi:hypothetical protein